MSQREKSTKDEEVLIIEPAKYGGPIFIGRGEGSNLRDRFDLDDFDETDQRAHIIFPVKTKGIGSSFFLAMLGKSIRSAGSGKKFLDKFQFSGPEYLTNDLVPSMVERALFEGDLFGSKNDG